MNDPFADESTAPQETSFKWRQLLYAFLFVCGLFVFNVLIYTVTRSWVPSFYRWYSDRWLVMILDMALASFFAQCPVVWLLFRKHITSTVPRVLAGLFVCHFVGVLHYVDWSFSPEVNTGKSLVLGMCAMFCITYFVHALFLEGATRVFGLTSIWDKESTRSRFSIGALLGVCSVTAVLACEISLAKGDTVEYSVDTFVAQSLVLVLLASSSSLMVALGLGMFFGRKRGWFLIAFLFCIFFAPAFFYLIATFWGVAKNLWDLTALYLMLWSYTLTVLLVFPLLSQRCSLSRKC